MKKIILLLLLTVIMSCKYNKKNDSDSKNTLSDFKPESYELRNNNIKLIKGQVIYLPIYSNIPHFMDSIKIDMSAFIAFHNTDFKNTIKLQQVQYFDTKGELVKDFLLEKTIVLGPLETTNFYVPYKDQSGTGANFLIEWKSDSLVTEPLVESITINTKMHNCVAVLSSGKVIKETK